MNTQSATSDELRFRGVGRNDICPCGSGKKFKKCHEPVLSSSKVDRNVASPQVSAETPEPKKGMFGLPPGMDAKTLWQVAKVLKKVPKGQLQQLQALMQQAMAGKDVTRQMKALQESLPPDVQKILMEMAEKQTQAQPTPSSADSLEVPQSAPKKGSLFSRWKSKKAPQ